ncbi:hypothetical protein Q8F55_003359 [Vanrija albida]|uniref:Uncharacterized protein n=1 Tax=Vanrija albida TaxID=181172 RepID=A0ABR3Q3S1_9TREE
MDDKGSGGSTSSTSSSVGSASSVESTPSWWRRLSASSSGSGLTPSPPPLPLLSLPPEASPPPPSASHAAKASYLIARGHDPRAAAKQLAAVSGDVARAEHRLHLRDGELRVHGCGVCDEKRRAERRGVGMSIAEWRAAEAEAASDDEDDGLPVYVEHCCAPRRRNADERGERIARLEALLAHFAPQLGDVGRVPTAELGVPRQA